MDNINWNELENRIIKCRKCELGMGRINPVIGRGAKTAPVMLVGEGPGQQEDKTGIPFVGAAGKLLDLLLNAVPLKPEEYYIANIVKCRPPGNRDPKETEAKTCMPYLRVQTRLIKPKIIVCMGRVAAKYLLRIDDVRITKIRGQWYEKMGYLFMPVFHPAALLRDESKKELMWKDFIEIRKKLDELAI